VEKKDFKILVADDDEIARDVISSLLSKEEYPVVTAKDGIEAIRILRLEGINLVITDLRMPGADGIEVLKYAVRKNPDIAVVIITAYGTLDTAIEAIKEGAYDYMTKPYKVQEILALAEKAFKRELLIQENRELIQHLRDTYRDIEVIKTIAGSKNPEITTSWIERIERLKGMNVLTTDEVEILKERLVKGYGRGENTHRR
jgi:two-component system, NtrC family, response regulator AtoC